MIQHHSTPKPEVDRQTIERHLAALFDQACEEHGLHFCIFTLPQRQARFFQSPTAAVEHCARAAESKQNVYACMGLFESPPAHGRGDVAAVSAISCLWADVDVADETAHKGKQYPASMDQAIDVARVGDLTPTMQIDSGFGLHVYWMLREPWLFEKASDNEDARVLLRRWIASVQWRAKARDCVVDSVHDLTRVLRVAGTLNWKRADDPRPVAIVHDDRNARYDMDDLEQRMVAPELADASTVALADVGDFIIDPNATIDEKLIKAILANDETMRATWRRERSDMADQSPSAYEMSLANHFVRMEWDDQAIVDALVYWRRVVVGEPKNRVDYYQRTIGKARAAAAERNGRAPEPERAPPPAWTPFPTEALPRATADLVRKGAIALQTDEGMLGPLALSAMSAAVGNTRAVQLSSSWREPAILWSVVIAPSGAGKSPALDLVTRPAERRDGDSFKAYEHERHEHAAALTAHKRSKSPEPPPEAPTCERFVTNDTTFEALAAMLAASPRGLLLAQDELAAWFGGFTRYSGASGRPTSEAARWLPMHRAGPLKVDRKTSPPLRIERASLNIAGLIQPGVLAAALNVTDYDSGLVARLLLAMPPTPTRKWRPEGGLTPGTERAYTSMMGMLYSLDLNENERGDPEPRALPLDDEAKEVWEDYYNSLNADMAGADERTRAMLSKLEGGAARLALVVHLGRLAGGESADPHRIDGESMRRGVALATWFRHEGERVYGRLGETETDGERRTLVELIERKGGDVSARDLMRASRRFATAAEAEAALGDLAEAGVGRWVQPAQAGRGKPKARRFVLGSADGVDVDSIPPDAPENANTVNVNSVNARAEGASP